MDFPFPRGSLRFTRYYYIIKHRCSNTIQLIYLYITDRCCFLPLLLANYRSIANHRHIPSRSPKQGSFVAAKIVYPRWIINSRLVIKLYRRKHIFEVCDLSLRVQQKGRRGGKITRFNVFCQRVSLFGVNGDRAKKRIDALACRRGSFMQYSNASRKHRSILDDEQQNNFPLARKARKTRRKRRRYPSSLVRNGLSRLSI